MGGVLLVAVTCEYTCHHCSNDPPTLIPVGLGHSKHLKRLIYNLKLCFWQIDKILWILDKILIIVYNFWTIWTLLILFNVCFDFEMTWLFLYLGCECFLNIRFWWISYVWVCVDLLELAWNWIKFMK
jgi:hypothetical protein